MDEIRDSESISDDAESELQLNEYPGLNVASGSVEDHVIEIEEMLKNLEPSGAGVKSANGCPDHVFQIEEMLKNLEPPPSAKYCCIYKVPESLRNINKQSYTPRVVSIGPFHYSDERLKPTEALKKRYLKSLVDKSKKKIREYVELLKGLEERARKCYAETINMNGKDFVEMMLFDAGFILELLLRYNEHGKILSTPWLESDIYHDILLLENQIPFFVLEEMFTIANDTIKVDQNLRGLTLKFVEMYGVDNSGKYDEPIHHLADLILIMSRPITLKRLTQDNMFESAYSATDLHQAGVKFKVSSSSCLLDVKFEKGILKIPCFKLEDYTETLVRNLMALELCHYPSNSYIIDYIFFMDSLIHTSSDIELLVKKGIIVNRPGESKVAADLFNKLCVNVTIDDRNFYFSQICEDLKAYYKVPRRKWIATCTRDYFSSPWQTAATTFLVISFIQFVLPILDFIASKPSF